MRTIIIDDDKSSHDALILRLSPAHPDVKVLGSAFSVLEGLELVRQLQPELVFLDVELPDGTGFDLLEKIGKPAFYVVFITAYNKYAEMAFRFGALDFLTKPLDSTHLSETLGRVRERYQEKYTIEQLQAALDAFDRGIEKKPPNRICIPTNAGYSLVPLDNIIHLVAGRNYTDFHILNRSKPLVSAYNIGTHEKDFEHHPAFMRVHRSHIANLLLADEYVKKDGGYLLMRDGYQVPVSEKCKDELLARLGRL